MKNDKNASQKRVIFPLKGKFGLMFLFILSLLGCTSHNQPGNSGQSISEDKTQNVNTIASTKTPYALSKPVNLNNEKDREKFEKLVSELAHNRSLWQESKIANYDFVCQQGGGGMRSWSPALIKVRDNKMISTEEAVKSAYPRLNGYEDLDSVEKLFNYIQQSLEENYSVDVKYNKIYGYPERIIILFSFATDDNHFVSIKKFTIIK